MPRDELQHSRHKQRSAKLAKLALPPLRVSALSTGDLSKATYRLLIRALRNEVRRLQGAGSLDLEALGTAGKVLELLASGHASLEVKPTASPSQVVNILNSNDPAGMARLTAMARGEALVPQRGNPELGAQGTQGAGPLSQGPGTQGAGVGVPGGHFLRDPALTGTPSDIGESNQGVSNALVPVEEE